MTQQTMLLCVSKHVTMIDGMNEFVSKYIDVAVVRKM